MTKIEIERNRFNSELNSKRQYEREHIAQELGKREKEIFKNEVTFKNGVAKWRSNGRCVPMDIAVQYEYLEMPVDLEKHAAESDRELEAFFDAYRKQQKNRKRDPEEVYEMRAAFGEGATVVDVVTGEEFKL